MLDRVRLPSRTNQIWYESGIDTVDTCLDIQHYMNYPHDVVYRYNSRGFRDREWPEDLASAVWCLGDSFTVGLGCPLEHTWPYLLEQSMNRRCINVSLDGASNNWIARTARTIIQEVQPQVMVLQWSFIERRENAPEPKFVNKTWYQMYQAVRDPTWPDCDNVNDFPRLPVRIQQEILEVFLPQTLIVSDEQLRRGAVACSEQEDVRNTLECILSVESAATDTCVVHSFVPDAMIPPLLQKFVKELDQRGIQHIGPTEQIDRARDGLHYDIKTAEILVERLKTIINK